MNSKNLPELVDKPFKFHLGGILIIATSVLSILGITLLLILSFPLNWLSTETRWWWVIIIIFGTALTSTLGIGLSIGSLIQKGNKKILGILGCTLNGLAFTPICLSLSFTFIQTNSFQTGISDGCGFGTAKAWIDQNENGVWDTNEMPLAGVQFVVINNQQDYEYADKSTSNKSGEASLLTFPYTCNSLNGSNLVIQVTPPDAYRATTPDQVIISGDKLPHILGRTYLFGFIKQASP